MSVGDVTDALWQKFHKALEVNSVHPTAVVYGGDTSGVIESSTQLSPAVLFRAAPLPFALYHLLWLFENPRVQHLQHLPSVFQYLLVPRAWKRPLVHCRTPLRSYWAHMPRIVSRNS